MIISRSVKGVNLIPLTNTLIRCYSTTPRLGFNKSQTINEAKNTETNVLESDKAKGMATGGSHFMNTAPFQSNLQVNDQPLGDYLLTKPVYTQNELDSVKILEKSDGSVSDKLARLMVKALRSSFDLVTGYKHRPLTEDVKGKPIEYLQKHGYILSEKAWMRRFLFLESIAGVPGFCAAMIRHLSSLRRMRRDAGYIGMLLAEAENERLHLMTFMRIQKPSLGLRLMVLGGQGVFFNLFFLAYVINPRICHRFTAVLEEEAVITYTRAIEEIQNGYVPGWVDKDIPSIAKGYWQLGDNAKMIDLIKAIRADESNHRFTNHTLAELDLENHTNPLAIQEPDAIVRGTKLGFTLDESSAWLEKTQKEFNNLKQSKSSS